MKFLIGIAVIIIAWLVALGFWIRAIEQSNTAVDANTSATHKRIPMTLQSPAFWHTGMISPKYTCDGDNINPPLEIAGVPEKAKSLVLIVEDPDAPGGTWDHWLMWNIPPDTKSIEEDVPPEGVAGKNSGGSYGYTGPCPPDKLHRFFFKFYALDTTLDLNPASAKKEDVEHAMNGHVIGKAALMGRYDRVK